MLSKVKIYLGLLLLLFSCVYSIGWITLSYELKHSLKIIIADVEQYSGHKVYYSGSRMLGFPFAFKIILENVRIKKVGSNSNDYISGPDYNYEMEFGDLALSGNLLLNKFSVVINNNIRGSMMIDGGSIEGQPDDQIHVFHQTIKYHPKFNVTLRRSLARSMLRDRGAINMISEISHIKYEDSGYEKIDEEGNLIYASRAPNVLELKSSDAKNKRTGEISRDTKIVGKVDIKSESGDFDSAATINGKVPINKGHDFAVNIDGEFRVPSGYNARSRNHIYLHVNHLSYTDDDFAIKFSGSGGLVPAVGLIGEFKLLISNQEKFFSDFFSILFLEEKNYKAVHERILSVADEVSDDDILLIYRADDLLTATIGKTNAADLIKFIHENIGSANWPNDHYTNVLQRYRKGK